MEHLDKPRDGVRGGRLSLTMIGGSSEHDPMSVVSGQITGLCITLGAGHPGRNHCGEMTLGFLLDLHAYIYMGYRSFQSLSFNSIPTDLAQCSESLSFSPFVLSQRLPPPYNLETIRRETLVLL